MFVDLFVCFSGVVILFSSSVVCYLGIEVNRNPAGGLVSADNRLAEVVLRTLSHGVSPLVTQLHTVPGNNITKWRSHGNIHRLLVCYLALPIYCSELSFQWYGIHAVTLWSYQVSVRFLTDKTI